MALFIASGKAYSQDGFISYGAKEITVVFFSAFLHKGLKILLLI